MTQKSKWEKFKMKEDYVSIDTHEIIILVFGLIVLSLDFFRSYFYIFLICVVLFYWFKIRYIETEIQKKKQDIYNEYYNYVQPIPQGIIDKKVEKSRKILQYELDQLELQRKFLVDKLVGINLICLVLIEIFIK